MTWWNLGNKSGKFEDTIAKTKPNKHTYVFSIFDFGEQGNSQPIECEINIMRILLRRKLSGEGKVKL